MRWDRELRSAPRVPVRRVPLGSVAVVRTPAGYVGRVTRTSPLSEGFSLADASRWLNIARAEQVAAMFTNGTVEIIGKR